MGQLELQMLLLALPVISLSPRAIDMVLKKQGIFQ